MSVLKKDLRYKNPLAKGKFRNGACYCGSGKKIKHCHGKDSSITMKQMKEIQEIRESFVKKYNAALNNMEVTKND